VKSCHFKKTLFSSHVCKTLRAKLPYTYIISIKQHKQHQMFIFYKNKIVAFKERNITPQKSSNLNPLYNYNLLLRLNDSHLLRYFETHGFYLLLS